MPPLRWLRSELITALITVRCLQTAPADGRAQMWTARFLTTEKGRYEENQHCSLLLLLLILHVCFSVTSSGLWPVNANTLPQYRILLTHLTRSQVPVVCPLVVSCSNINKQKQIIICLY